MDADVKWKNPVFIDFSYQAGMMCSGFPVSLLADVSSTDIARQLP